MQSFYATVGLRGFRSSKEFLVTFFAVCPIAMGIIALMPAPAAGQPLLECAADTHLARKGDYLNGTTGMTDSGVWEWIIGSGDTYSNIQGITANGMFEATFATRDPAYALAAFDTANLLIGRYNADPSLRPYATDVLFLLNACAFDESDYVVESNQAYCLKAIDYYSRVVAEFSAVENVDRHIDPRASIAGWDVAWHIRSAWLAGFETYARDMAARIIERRPDWEHALYAGLYDYTELSWGNLVWVLVEMYREGDLDLASYTAGLDMADELIAIQRPDGSWADGDYQATAYAVLGFRADPWNWTTPWHQALVQGLNYLEATATASPTCGWAYDGVEYGEGNSEAITALAANGLPFFDGFESGDTSAWSSAVGDATPLQELVPPKLPKELLVGIEPFN